MRFLLDTDTCVFALRGHSGVQAHLRAHDRADCAVSAVTVAEIWFGARHSNLPGRARQLADAFLEPLLVLEFDLASAARYAEVRHELEVSGRRIGEADLLIACTSLARDLTLVTHNTREFARVPGLRVEDWTIEPVAGSESR